MNISRRNLLLLFAGAFAANAVHAKKAFADGAGVSGFEHLETLSSEGVSQLPDDIAGIRDQADSLGLSDVDFDNFFLGMEYRLTFIPSALSIKGRCISQF